MSQRQGTLTFTVHFDIDRDAKFTTKEFERMVLMRTYARYDYREQHNQQDRVSVTSIDVQYSNGPVRRTF